MMINTRRSARLSLPLSVASAAILLTGCGGSDGDFCAAVDADLGAAATAFAPYISFGSGPEMPQQMLDFLDRIKEPPEDLADDLAIWKERVREVRDAEVDGEVSKVVREPDDVQAARDALFDYYIQECLD
jgi:hypothetical protein